MKCLMRDCNQQAERGKPLCRPCDYWARVTLADPKYRNTPPPPRPKQERGI